MSHAIRNTITSVVGSSITTVAGFIALCFMSFTLGMDLGIVMAKGVIFGVAACVTVLPAMILIFDKAIEKTRHKPLIPDLGGISQFVTNKFYIFIILFVLVLAPAIYGYMHTDVYYNLDETLPKELDSIVANSKLQEEFNMNSTHMVLMKSGLDAKDANTMIAEMKGVDGVKTVLGMDALIGPTIPKEMIPEKIKEVLENDRYQLMLIMSEYKVAADEVNRQCELLNDIRTALLHQIYFL